MVKKFAEYVRGVGKVLEVSPHRPSRIIGQHIAEKNTYKALRSDWVKLGQDMQTAIDRTAAEIGERGQS